MPGSVRLITANVNGIRAAERRGGLRWLHAAGPDVLCLQEVRATAEQVTETLDAAGFGDWHLVLSPGVRAGHAGVAIASRLPLRESRRGLPAPLVDNGRWVEAEVSTDLGPLTVVSAYVHTGEAGTPRQAEKYEFLDAMAARMATVLRSMRRVGGYAVVCGDLNVAHREVDIKNWRGNRGKAGFIEGERAYFDRWLERDWVDLGRAHGGPGPGPYTWWSWRGRSFDTDGGWRIDYALASAPLAGLCTGAVVGRAATYAERWSDHAPLMVSFEAAQR